jgi:LysR family hydrogen peroxide-inducible transcriptional activator
MSGPLQLGLIPTIAPFIVPRIMPLIKAAYPKLKIYLREEQTAQLVSRLQSGQLDAAILALPVQLEGIETIDIARDPFWVVYPEGHRFSAMTSIAATDLALEDLLLLEDGHCMRDHALAACSLESARRNIAFQGTSLNTLVQMVANGLGITILPQMAIESGIIRGLPVASARLDGLAPYRRIALAWRRSSGRKETFRRLASDFQEFFATKIDA